MKYRITMKIRWHESYFDYPDEEQATIALKSFHCNYAGNNEEDSGDAENYKPLFSMSIIDESPTEGSPEEPSGVDVEGHLTSES